MEQMYIKIEKIEVNVNQCQIETENRTQEKSNLLKQLISNSEFWKSFINMLHNWY